MLYACLFLSGEHVKPGPLLGCFAGAQILGLVSHGAGRLGVFDGLMLLALTDAGYDRARSPPAFSCSHRLLPVPLFAAL